MADRIFRFMAHFGKCEGAPFGEEYGVVAEAVVAAALLEYRALHLTFEEVDFVVEDERKHCYKPRLAVHAVAHEDEHLLDVATAVAILSGETRRIHSRCAVEGIDFKSAVVGKAVVAIVVFDIARVDSGVVFECVAILHYIFGTTYVGETQYLKLAAYNLSQFL